jgi:hypothetical protein
MLKSLLRLAAKAAAKAAKGKKPKLTTAAPPRSSGRSEYPRSSTASGPARAASEPADQSDRALNFVSLLRSALEKVAPSIVLASLELHDQWLAPAGGKRAPTEDLRPSLDRDAAFRPILL